jgi:outer membrane protein TolC
MLLNYGAASGQNVDYTKIIPSDSVAEKDIAEKLVQLAWKNNPDNKQVIDASISSKYDWKVSKVTFLNSLVASGNLNEFNLNPPSNNQFNNLFPRYNIALTIPLGIYPVNHFTSKSFQKKYDVSVDKINSQKLDIRNKVLVKYQDYLLAKELLKIETLASDEASAQFLVEQKKFKDNRGTLQAYNEAQKAYNAENIIKLTYQRNFNVAKYDLERLIGVSLDFVIPN